MNYRCCPRPRRWILWMAALPLLQIGSCGAEFFSAAVANEAANRIAIFFGTSLETVLLNSFGKLTPFGDSNRIRKWIEGGVDG